MNLSLASSTPSFESIQSICKKSEDSKCVNQVYDLANNQKTDLLKKLCDSHIKIACGYYSYELPVRFNDYWLKQFKSKSLPSWQYIQAPSDLITLLEIENRAAGYKEKPQKTSLNADLKKIVEDSIKNLREKLGSWSSDRLIGVSIVKNLGSSAITVEIIDPNKLTTHYIVILDEKILHQNANDWITYKDRSAFNGNQSIQTVIEEKQNNNVSNTLEFLLLHEFAHIIGHQKKLTQFGVGYRKLFEDVDAPKYTSYFWDVSNDFKPKADFPLRESIRFYRNVPHPLSDKETLSVYQEFKKSAFPTLYSVTHPAEDFADSFASYYHSVILKKPYTVTISSSKNERLVIDSCWNESRCKERRRFFDALFEVVK